MGVTTLEFFLFMIVSLIVYYLIPKKCQWVWLLIISCFFYLNSSHYLSIFISVTCVSTYVIAMLIEKSDLKYKAELKLIKAGELDKDKKQAKAQNAKRKVACIWAASLINLGMLVVLKFYDLIFQEINTKFFGGAEGFFPLLHLALPLGISFYTFQALGYLIDIYRGHVKPEHNFFKSALFIVWFPQVIQGPFSRFNQLGPELYNSHEFDFKNITDGFYLILWGCFKKMVIADRAGIMCDYVFNSYQNFHGMHFWVASVAYAFQMYGDFSGGIDIIRGAAKMFGVEMVDNFERPYFSKNIPEFWRRWHITLGTWFRDYLFYPISFSLWAKNLSKTVREKTGNLDLAKFLPSYIATIVLWIGNGMWHGAGIQYILFGIYHGVLTILSMAYTKKNVALGKKLGINMNCGSWTFFQIARTMLLVTIGRVIYIAPDFHATLVVLKEMFTAHNFWILFDGGVFNLGLGRQDCYIMLFAWLVVLVVEIIQERGVHIREYLYEQNLYLRWGLAFGLLFVILIFGIYGQGYDAAGFIYMQY